MDDPEQREQRHVPHPAAAMPPQSSPHGVYLIVAPRNPNSLLTSHLRGHPTRAPFDRAFVRALDALLLEM